MNWANTVLICLVVLGAGCASTALSPAGKSVRLMKADPPKACTEIGAVDSRVRNWADSGTHEAMKNLLRNRAAKKGANYVRLEAVSKNKSSSIVYSGTAFKCPR